MLGCKARLSDSSRSCRTNLLYPRNLLMRRRRRLMRLLQSASCIALLPLSYRSCCQCCLMRCKVLLVRLKLPLELSLVLLLLRRRKLLQLLLCQVRVKHPRRLSSSHSRVRCRHGR